MNEPSAILLIFYSDSPGLVAKITNFIYADQHTDLATSLFLIPLEWQLEGSNLSC